MIFTQVSSIICAIIIFLVHIRGNALFQKIERSCAKNALLIRKCSKLNINPINCLEISKIRPTKTATKRHVKCIKVFEDYCQRRCEQHSESGKKSDTILNKKDGKKKSPKEVREQTDTGEEDDSSIQTMDSMSPENHDFHPLTNYTPIVVGKPVALDVTEASIQVAVDTDVDVVITDFDMGRCKGFKPYIHLLYSPQSQTPWIIVYP